MRHAQLERITPGQASCSGLDGLRLTQNSAKSSRSSKRHITEQEPSMPSAFENAPVAAAMPITFVTQSSWEAVRGSLSPLAARFARANGFAAKPGACLILPAADGQIDQVLFGLEDEDAKSRDLFRPGALPGMLPKGVYRFAN